MRQRCGMRLPGATGKAAPGAERGQRYRELIAPCSAVKLLVRAASDE